MTAATLNAHHEALGRAAFERQRASMIRRWLLVLIWL